MPLTWIRCGCYGNIWASVIELFEFLLVNNGHGPISVCVLVCFNSVQLLTDLRTHENLHFFWYFPLISTIRPKMQHNASNVWLQMSILHIFGIFGVAYSSALSYFLISIFLRRNFINPRDTFDCFSS